MLTAYVVVSHQLIHLNLKLSSGKLSQFPFQQNLAGFWCPNISLELGMRRGKLLAQIASGESICWSCSKKGRLLKNQWNLNLKKIAFTVEKFVFAYFSLKFSHYIVSEAKCVEEWKSETHWWAHYPVRETKLQNFEFVGPAYWIWEPLRFLISRNARLSSKRRGSKILAQVSAEKQWEGARGGGVCITLAPHYE